MRLRITLCLACSLPVLQPASAQQVISTRATGDTVVDAEHASRRDAFTVGQIEDGPEIVGRAGPVERPAGSFSAPVLQFSAEAGETIATLALNIDLSDSRPERSEGKIDDNAEYFNIQSWKAGFKVASPLGEDKKNSSVFSFGNLTNGSKLTLSVSRFATVVRDGAGALGYLKAAYRACVKSEASNWAAVAFAANAKAYDNANFYVTGYELEVARRNASSSTVLTGGSVIEAKKNEPEPAPTIHSKCYDSANVPNNQTLIERYLGNKEKEEFDNTYFTKRPLTFFGLESSAVRANFNFLDAQAFKVASTGRTGLEAAVYFGRISANGDKSIRAQFIYSRTFEQSDDLEICRTPSGGTQQECIEGPNGLPTKSTKALLSVEARKMFSAGSSESARPFAISPQVTVDIKRGDFAIDVPIYLTANESGQLTGGFRVGYRSDIKDYGAGIFVGIPFSIFFQ